MKELALDQEHHHQLAHDEQDVTARPLLRRAARARGRDAANQGSTAPGGDVGVAGLFSQAINAGLGHALPDNLRETFETSLGTSLSDVRVHTDGRAAASADAFDAHAFAHGQNIFFGAGQYRPGTPDGDQLIAHEVAHTVQQRGAAPTTQHKLAISEPGDAMEHAADAAALAMTRGERTGVGSAGLTVARQSRGATAPQPAQNPAAAGGRSIAQQFPQGITVAISLMPENIDQRAARILGRGRSLRQEVNHAIRGQLPGGHPATRRINTALGTPEHTITHAEAHDLAEALCANDGEFARRAADFVAGHQVVGGDPAAPRIGAPVTFDVHDNAVDKLRTLSRTVGQLPGGTGAGNIRHLAIFTHGDHHWLELGTFTGGAQNFVAQLSGCLTHDVTVGMYACNAAAGDAHGQAFAQDVAEGLAHDGHDARVFGHENAANAAYNPRGREYVARAGQNGPAASHTNVQMVFAPAFRAEQIASIAQRVGIPSASVEGVFDDASRHWLMHAMPGIHMPGARGLSAAFQIGFDPEGAVAACQAAWRTAGVEVIRQALHAPPPHAASAPAPAASVPAAPHAAESPAPAAPAPRVAEPSVSHAPANLPERRAPVHAAPAAKPAMDPHAKDPVRPGAAPAAPASAPSNGQAGALAVVQRPGPIHPRHPGNSMVLHAAPDSRQAAEHIVPGTFVHVIRREGDWTLVQHRDHQGWIENANLREATLSQEDTRQEAGYRLGVLESGNDAGEYTPDSHRVNIGVASWTGSRIGGLLRRYERIARDRGQLADLHAHFGGEAHWNEIVARFAHPSMRGQEVPDGHGGTRTWVGPQLSAEEQQQFQTAETALPFIREADEQQVQADIDMYLRALGHTAYPFFGADHSISEVALNVIVSGFHQGGMGGLPARIHTTNAFFGVNTHPQDEHHPDPPQSPLLVRSRTDELTYLRQLGTLLPSHTRYAQILSQYADSPRRFPVP